MKEQFMKHKNNSKLVIERLKKQNEELLDKSR